MSVSVNVDSVIPPEPLLIPAEELARLLQVSTRTLLRLRSAGELPQPVRLGGTVRWRLDEVRKWIAEGCPSLQVGDCGRGLDSTVSSKERRLSG